MCVCVCVCEQVKNTRFAAEDFFCRIIYHRSTFWSLDQHQGILSY